MRKELEMTRLGGDTHFALCKVARPLQAERGTPQGLLVAVVEHCRRDGEKCEDTDKHVCFISDVLKTNDVFKER